MTLHQKKKINNNNNNNDEKIVESYNNVIVKFIERVFEAAQKLKKENQEENDDPWNVFWKLTDEFRDKIFPQYGIRIEDGKTSIFGWFYLNPKYLLLELAFRKKWEKEQQLKIVSIKLKKDIERKEKEFNEFNELVNVSVVDYFRTSETEKGKYSKFDERGVPTHAADGKELGKKTA